MDHIISN